MKLFINYRRADDKVFVELLRTHFMYHYGRENVFMDFDSIPEFSRFEDFIKRKIAEADVVIVIIGSRWLEHIQNRQEKGEEDFVRIEIEEALRLKKPLAPIAIQGASVPDLKTLPSELHPVFDFNIAAVSEGKDLLLKIESIIHRLNELTGKQSVSNPQFIINESNEQPPSLNELQTHFTSAQEENNLPLQLLLLEQLREQGHPAFFNVDAHLEKLRTTLLNQEREQQRIEVRDYLYTVVRFMHTLNDSPDSILDGLREVWQVEENYDPDNIAQSARGLMQQRIQERDRLYESARVMHTQKEDPQKILDSLNQLWNIEKGYDPDNIAQSARGRLSYQRRKQKRIEKLYETVRTMHTQKEDPQAILDKLNELWNVEKGYDPDDIAGSAHEQLEQQRIKKRDRLYETVRAMHAQEEDPQAILDRLDELWKVEEDYDPDSIAQSAHELLRRQQRTQKRDKLYETTRIMHAQRKYPQKILDSLNELWKVEKGYDPDNIARSARERLSYQRRERREQKRIRKRDGLYKTVRTMHTQEKAPQAILDKLNEVWKVEKSYDPDNIAQSAREQLKKRNLLYEIVRAMHTQNKAPQVILDGLSEVWKVEKGYDPDNINASILHPLNPINWLRLYLWIFFTPQYLRHVHKPNLQKTGSRLNVTLALLPLFISLIGVLIGNTDWNRIEGLPRFITPLSLLIFSILLWIAPAIINILIEILDNVVGGMAIGVAIIVAIGVAGGVTFGMAFVMAFGVAVGTVISAAGTVALGTVLGITTGVVAGIIAFGLEGALVGIISGGLALGVALSLQNILKDFMGTIWQKALGLITPICYVILITQYWFGVTLP